MRILQLQEGSAGICLLLFHLKRSLLEFEWKVCNKKEKYIIYLLCFILCATVGGELLFVLPYSECQVKLVQGANNDFGQQCVSVLPSVGFSLFLLRLWTQHCLSRAENTSSSGSSQCNTTERENRGLTEQNVLTASLRICPGGKNLFDCSAETTGFDEASFIRHIGEPQLFLRRVFLPNPANWLFILRRPFHCDMDESSHPWKEPDNGRLSRCCLVTCSLHGLLENRSW